MHRYQDLPGPSYAYLLGMYLGDGHITVHKRGVYRLGITLDRKYQGIVGECADAMRTVMPSSKTWVQQRPNENTDFVASYSKAWTCLFPQHGPGRKHQRRIYLAEWQVRFLERETKHFLRGLIHSDGSYSVNTIKHPHKTYVYPRYLFSNRSNDIQRLFCQACDLLGIEWRQMNRWNISVAKHESVATMDEFIGPKE